MNICIGTGVPLTTLLQNLQLCTDIVNMSDGLYHEKYNDKVLYWDIQPTSHTQSLSYDHMNLEDFSHVTVYIRVPKLLGYIYL